MRRVGHDLPPLARAVVGEATGRVAVRVAHVVLQQAERAGAQVWRAGVVHRRGA